ncbi:hypothetical protein TRFO_21646 [Tritrichomonas foetus]|uniref:Integral membrane protein n=1 Tax=Tritrichomonas foetus TaxID=1144522 RepID=A0A1J4KEH1_9EUKA|nr:hypothetical protein TRFO_21646 [Tritrichomonas foetus]|eukprot:OHT09418.1 hypothetical protein TRFO_21646 [Tritrichomonas foetus]
MNSQVIIPSLLFICLGVLNALLEKSLYQQEALGLPKYGVHKCSKPHFFCSIGFAGMGCAVFFYILMTKLWPSKFESIKKVSWKQFSEFLIPATFDLMQGTMSSVTIAFVGLSFDYMMRCGTLVGVTIIAKIYFKKKFHTYQWVAIGIIISALIIIGLSSMILADQSSTINVPPKVALSIIFLKFLAQFCYSIKLSYEQYFSQDIKLNPTLVVGLEGSLSTLMEFLIVLPIVHFLPGEEGNGIHEDFFDTIEMMKNSKTVLILMLSGMVWCGVYNVFAVSLTEASSAVTRTLLESFRTFIIWGIQIAIFYICSSSESLKKYSSLGEEWCKGSFLQLGGYIVMIIGILLYYGHPRILISNKRSKKNLNEYIRIESEPNDDM